MLSLKPHCAVSVNGPFVKGSSTRGVGTFYLDPTSNSGGARFLLNTVGAHTSSSVLQEAFCYADLQGWPTLDELPEFGRPVVRT